MSLVKRAKGHFVSSLSLFNRIFTRFFRFRFARLLKYHDFLQIIAWLSPCSNGHTLIRIGAERDGGYLLPDDLEEIVACFSPGTDQVIEFERYFLDKGILCYLVDASIKEHPFKESHLIDFRFNYISAVSDGIYLSLEDWISRSLSTANTHGDLILQMDIEGWEYQSLLACPSSLLTKFRIIVIEFHDFHRCMDRYFYRDVIKPLLFKLSACFDPVHIHPNNASPEFHIYGHRCPQAFELTLHRKDRRISEPQPCLTHLPNPLDRDNIPDGRKISISSMWPAHRPFSNS